MTPIFAAQQWPSNAAMIADVHALGYLNDDDHVLDPTYGKGNWWSEWKPKRLDCTDISMGVDFRCLPFPDEEYDAIAYDPPYVSMGGRTTTGIPDMHAAYGLTDAPKSPKELQSLINDGLTEMLRVVKCGGIVIVKCQDYISSGKLWLGTHHTLSHALALGSTVEDRLEHISGPRPQPPRRRQVHARRNLSTLFVLRSPRVSGRRFGHSPLIVETALI